jgi:hypothetical protein
MTRAMGLIWAVLAFAVVAHADRIGYGGSDYAAGAVPDLRSEAPSTEVLHSPNLLIEPGGMAFRANGALFGSGDAERLTDYVFYSSLGLAKAVEGSAEFDSNPGNLGARYGEGGEYFRVEHPDPFRRELGVQEVPEAGTLVLMSAGLGALALWKRRMITPE